MAILDNSTKNLGRLKEQVEPLVDFFKNVLGEIDNNVDQHLEAFLRPVINGITEGSNPEEVQAINVSRRSKEVSAVVTHSFGRCKQQYCVIMG
jgi:hypothetical protein